MRLGDRIAIMRRGGYLDQFAPPAELLTWPANPFVASFVGADRAIKRLALQRVRAVDLWKAPLVRVDEPAAAARARAADSEVPYPLLIDEERPAARLALRARARRRTGRPTSCARRRSRCWSWTTSCATRFRACSPRRPSTARWSTSAARSSGVLSIEILAHALRADPEEIPHRGRRDRMILELAQVQIHTRTDTCEKPQRLLPELDRRPLRRLRRPVLPARLAHGRGGGDRLRDLVHAGAGRLPAPLADQPGHPGHRDPLHDPEHRGVLPAAAGHRPRHRHRADRARLLRAADHLPQRPHRARQRARRRPRTPGAGWG